MIPILISHILRTNLRGLDNLFMDKGKIYTFLNPVSYLMALDRKDLFGQFDTVVLCVGHKEFQHMNIRDFLRSDAGVVYDVKAVLNKNIIDGRL